MRKTTKIHDIVLSDEVLSEQKEVDSSLIQQWISPILIFSIFLLIYVLKSQKIFELLCCILVGGAGLLLGLMWIFSEHPEVQCNFNTLWCNPLFLIYIPFMFEKKSLKALAYTLLIFNLSAILIWIVGYQSFDIGIIPILIISVLFNMNRIYKTGYNKGQGN